MQGLANFTGYLLSGVGLTVLIISSGRRAVRVRFSVRRFYGGCCRPTGAGIARD